MKSPYYQLDDILTDGREITHFLLVTKRGVQLSAIDIDTYVSVQHLHYQPL